MELPRQPGPPDRYGLPGQRPWHQPAGPGDQSAGPAVPPDRPAGQRDWPAAPRDWPGGPQARYAQPRGLSADPRDRPADRQDRYADPGTRRPEPPGRVGGPASRRPGQPGQGFLPGYGPGDRPGAGDRYGTGDRYGAAAAGYRAGERYGPQDRYRYRGDSYGAPDDDYGNDAQDGWDPGYGGYGPPEERRRRGRWAGPTALLIVAAVILIPLIIGGLYAYHRISAHYDVPDYSGPGTGLVIFQVKPGDTATTVGDRLVSDGVVASSRAFVLAAEHSSNPNALQPGFYRLHKHMNSTLAWNLLLDPADLVQDKVTIPEGLRVSNILAVLGKYSGIPASDYASAIKDTAALGLPSYANGNPEGYLFPDTYEIQPNMTATSVLRAMVTAFDNEAAAAGLPQAAADVNLTPAQVIVVASLAQAEGGSTADFPKITRVIYNRLAQGMPLDLDSTVMFALNTYGIAATDQQLQVHSPYNTYLNKGLPPGPIDCPGAAAIQAALHPASGNWLYFITVNPKTGQTDFTNSLTVFDQLRAELEQNIGHGG